GRGGGVGEGSGDALDVVGVTADYAAHQFQQRHAAPKIFVPLTQDASSIKRVPIVVRAAGEPAPLVQTLRRELRRTPGTAVGGAFTYDEVTRVGAEELLVGMAPLVPLIAIGML